jgi:hypothetical protein
LPAVAQSGAAVAGLKHRNPTFEKSVQTIRAYAALATQAARDLAQYQSPKLSAVAVGQVKMTVIVKGGLPPRKIEASALPAPPSERKNPNVAAVWIQEV